MKSKQQLIQATLALVAGTAGCANARLDIEVATYTGPLIESASGTPSSALGLAHSMYLVAYRAGYQNKSRGIPDKRKADFQQLADQFEDLFLSCKCVQSMHDADGKGGHPAYYCLETALKDPDLVLKLKIFEKAAAHTAETVGFEDSFAGIFGDVDVQRDAAAIDEGSRVLRDYLNIYLSMGPGSSRRPDSSDSDTVDVVDVEFFSDPVTGERRARLVHRSGREIATGVTNGPLEGTPTTQPSIPNAVISGIMASQKPSVLTQLLTRVWPGASDLYEARYWSVINNVHLEGSGDSEYVVMKDEIGNWHIKKVLIDPSKLIYAIQSAATAAINVAAAAAGVPVNLPMPEKPIFADYFDDKLDINEQLLENPQVKTRLATSKPLLDLEAALREIVNQAESDKSGWWTKERVEERVKSAFEKANNDLKSAT